MKAVGRLVISVVVAAAILGTGVTVLLVVPGPAHVGPVILGVGEGERFGEIAGRLEGLSVIRSALALRLWARVTGRDRSVAWGDYLIQPPISSLMVLDRLALPPDPIGRVTIPEGLTVDQTIALLVEHSRGPRDDFAAVVRDPAFLEREGLSVSGAEGYLFPDTYVLPSTMSPEQVLHEMIERFRRQFDQHLTAQGRALGLTPEQVVTLASLIEEETTVADEQRLVSGVFHNRLRLGMRLQSDPTVLYGRPEGDRAISKRDLQEPTAHNTYVITGLPPSPIANPGRGALEAAVNPATTTALYFVARGDGSHEFTSTLAAHNAAVRRYQREP